MVTRDEVRYFYKLNYRGRFDLAEILNSAKGELRRYRKAGYRETTAEDFARKWAERTTGGAA